MPADIVCRGCGVTFTAKRSDAMWCLACRIANARQYVRNYDSKITHPCIDCGTQIGRNAVRCRICDNKWRAARYEAEGNPNWQLGRTRTKDGYIRIRVTPHKIASKAYRLEHRIIWEMAHGLLPKGHIIHHLNGIKDDNRLENLAAMSRSEHHTRHAGPYEARIRELEAKFAELQQLTPS